MRKIGLIHGFAAAALIAAMPFEPVPFQNYDPDTGRRKRRERPEGMTGPVIDTTPESKRAKRRRLARQRAAA